MAGNLLGTKSWYLYVDDAGATWTILQDDDLAAAAGNEKGVGSPPKPDRLRPRVAHVEDNEGNRKAIVCGSVDSPIYAQNVTVAINIAGTVFATTGRRGERFTVARNRPEPAP